MLNHWKIGLKRGMQTFAFFSAVLFVYGLFNNFTFWHAFAHAGTQSGIAHMIYYGVFAGPVVFLIAAFAAMYFSKLKSLT
ncbi:hypothetical protein MCEMSEM29_01434 [Methylophilaceae bacterium]|jgi:hypothetical protein